MNHVMVRRSVAALALALAVGTGLGSVTSAHPVTANLAAAAPLGTVHETLKTTSDNPTVHRAVRNAEQRTVGRI